MAGPESSPKGSTGADCARLDGPALDRLRPLAFTVAYRMLGSVTEAEDVVQEALTRLSQAEGVRNPDAFVTTVTTRIAIDVLRSARVRRESYVGEWLPEPLVGPVRSNLPVAMAAPPVLHLRHRHRKELRSTGPGGRGTAVGRPRRRRTAAVTRRRPARLARTT